MVWILLFLLALPLLLVLLRKNNNETGLLPPGPPGLPFIGNLHQIDNTAPHLGLCQLSKQYGPLMSLRLGLVPTLVVSSAKMAKEVFKTQDVTFSGRPSLLGQQKMSYNGLDLAFSPYNDYYKEMRKICTLHLFSAKRVQSFRSVREDEVYRMIHKISKSCGEPINLSETFMDYSSSVTCRVAFGKRYEDEGSDRRRFHGSDTAAAALVWTMTALIKNPKVMTKIQEEITSLAGKKGFVNEDDLQSLPYLKAVVKETMRLYPATPLLVPRETTQSCSLEGYVIKPKTLVFVNAWAIGRDPEAWENPEEFWPERFLTKSIDFKGQDFELIPFGAGRRVCPGMNLGAIVVELALANLVYSFRWELPPGVNEQDINTDVKPGVTMHKKDALCLVATKIDGIKARLV